MSTPATAVAGWTSLPERVRKLITDAATELKRCAENDIEAKRFLVGWSQDYIAIREGRLDGPPTNDHIRYLLWDNERQMWWRPNDRGYTHDVDDAGRYTQDQAVERALRAALGGLDHAAVIVAEHTVQS